MLAPDDLALVQREQALPGLATLLDEERLLATLRDRLPSRRAGADLKSIRANYVRYKPATSCLVGYELFTAAGSVEMYASALSRRAGNEKLNKPVRKPVTCDAVGAAALVVPDDCLDIRFFPHDREIRGLRLLAKPDDSGESSRSVLPDRPEM